MHLLQDGKDVGAVWVRECKCAGCGVHGGGAYSSDGGEGRCSGWPLHDGELRLIGAAGADERHSKGQEHRDGRLHGRERGRRECQCFLSGLHDDDVF